MNASNRTYVECYSGYMYAQEPRSFVFREEQRTVQEVRQRWREPTRLCYEVLADDGTVYLLAYHEATDQWYVSR
jgi:hypothetical protein